MEDFVFHLQNLYIDEALPGGELVANYLSRISLFYLVEGYFPGTSLTWRPTSQPRAPTQC